MSQPHNYTLECDPALPHYDKKLQYNDRETMQLFQRGGKRAVPAWVWDNKKICAIILDVLRRRAAVHYTHLLQDKNRDWLEAKVQQFNSRKVKCHSYSEKLAFLIWHYYRLRWPMTEIARGLQVTPGMLWWHMVRVNETGRRLFPNDSLPKKIFRKKPWPPRRKVVRVPGIKINQMQVYEMRLAGKSFPDIAKVLGRKTDSVLAAYYLYCERFDLPWIHVKKYNSGRKRRAKHAKDES